jgi:hypothetical protein
MDLMDHQEQVDHQELPVLQDRVDHRVHQVQVVLLVLVELPVQVVYLV